MEIIVATKNKGKLVEIKDLLKDLPVKVSSLEDYPEIPEIAEDKETFLENSRKKAAVVAEATGKWSLADDSGLVVEALKGGPGVRSARYAGRQGDHAANNRKLLEEMKDVPDGKRKARFVCAMVITSPDGRQWDIEERCEGEILRELKGSRGFGYDPLFFIPDKGKTMAELPLEEKNKISHRGKALRHMKEVLKKVLSGRNQ
jgi:XTP/dITP diphosphohydrolase